MLDDLHSELTKLGFKLSHLAVCIQLKSGSGDSHNCKRYVQTVPVEIFYARKIMIEWLLSHLYITFVSCVKCLVRAYFIYVK